jgi:hypothetical protein
MSWRRPWAVVMESTSMSWPMTVPGPGRVASLSKAVSKALSCSSFVVTVDGDLLDELVEVGVSSAS